MSELVIVLLFVLAILAMFKGNIIALMEDQSTKKPTPKKKKSVSIGYTERKRKLPGGVHREKKLILTQGALEEYVQERMRAYKLLIWAAFRKGYENGIDMQAKGYVSTFPDKGMRVEATKIAEYKGKKTVVTYHHTPTTSKVVRGKDVIADKIAAISTPAQESGYYEER